MTPLIHEFQVQGSCRGKNGPPNLSRTPSEKFGPPPTDEKT